MKTYLYIKALGWVVLVTCFTYTAILVTFVQKGVDVNAIYCSNQSSVAALLVNIGLVAMVFFDYFYTGRQIPNYIFLLMFVAFFLAVVTYGHSALVVRGGLGTYSAPLSWKWMGVVMHLVFLAILMVLKEKAYEMDNQEVAKQFKRNK